MLPSLIVLGLGGLIFAPAISCATFGWPEDSGVASAMVNTMQQVGGSIGTALLTTLAAHAPEASLRTDSGPDVQALAAVPGYDLAFPRPLNRRRPAEPTMAR